MGIRNGPDGDELTAEERHSSHDATFLQHVRSIEVPEEWTALEWFVRFSGSGSVYLAAPMVLLGDYAAPRFSDEADQPQRAIVLSLGDTCPTGFRELCEVENTNLLGIVGDPNVLLDQLNIVSGQSIHDHGGRRRSGDRFGTRSHWRPTNLFGKTSQSGRLSQHPLRRLSESRLAVCPRRRT